MKKIVFIFVFISSLILSNDNSEVDFQAMLDYYDGEIAQKLDVDGEMFYQLGVDYLRGTGDKKYDISKSIKYFKLAANKGHAKAMYRLGYIYMKRVDYGIPRNYQKAAYWLEKSLETNKKFKGIDNANYLLALLYTEGNGVPKNITKAITLYKKVSKQMPDAKMALAEIYFEGNGVKADKKKAVALLEELANMKYKIYEALQAKSILADIYYKGDGVPQNRIRACKFWKELIQKGANEEIKKKYEESCNKKHSQKIFADVVAIASDDTLSVRQNPGTQYEKIGDLSYDAKNIEVLDCVALSSGQNKRWCLIQYPGGENNMLRGWVSAKYLMLQNTKHSISHMEKPNYVYTALTKQAMIAANEKWIVVDDKKSGSVYLYTSYNIKEYDEGANIKADLKIYIDPDKKRWKYVFYMVKKTDDKELQVGEYSGVKIEVKDESFPLETDDEKYQSKFHKGKVKTKFYGTFYTLNNLELLKKGNFIVFHYLLKNNNSKLFRLSLDNSRKAIDTTLKLLHYRGNEQQTKINNKNKPISKNDVIQIQNNCNLTTQKSTGNAKKILDDVKKYDGEYALLVKSINACGFYIDKPLNMHYIQNHSRSDLVKYLSIIAKYPQYFEHTALHPEYLYCPKENTEILEYQKYFSEIVTNITFNDKSYIPKKDLKICDIYLEKFNLAKHEYLGKNNKFEWILYMYAISKYPDKFKKIKNHTLDKAMDDYRDSIGADIKKLLDKDAIWGTK